MVRFFVLFALQTLAIATCEEADLNKSPKSSFFHPRVVSSRQPPTSQQQQQQEQQQEELPSKLQKSNQEKGFKSNIGRFLKAMRPSLLLPRSVVSAPFVIHENVLRTIIPGEQLLRRKTTPTTTSSAVEEEQNNNVVGTFSAGRGTRSALNQDVEQPIGPTTSMSSNNPEPNPLPTQSPNDTVNQYEQPTLEPHHQNERSDVEMGEYVVSGLTPSTDVTNNDLGIDLSGDSRGSSNNSQAQRGGKDYPIPTMLDATGEWSSLLSYGDLGQGGIHVELHRSDAVIRKASSESVKSSSSGRSLVPGWMRRSSLSSPASLGHSQGQQDERRTVRASDASQPSNEDRGYRAHVEIVLDPHRLGPILEVLLQASRSLCLSLLGTIRLLVPMIFARRVLAYFLYGMADWYTGRYLRTQYLKLEYHYWRYYQIPAALRSVGRVLTQALFMFAVGRILENSWLHPNRRLLFDTRQGQQQHRPWWSCSVESDTNEGGNTGCQPWCGMVWILSVVGVGHVVGRCMENWKTPLRIQVSPCAIRKRKRGKNNNARARFWRPWSLLQWLRDPEAVIRDFSKGNGNTLVLREFVPNPYLFPSSWHPLRLLPMIAMAKQMPNQMNAMMRQLLFQEVLRDEWHRVLLVEKRVALGVVFVTLYAVSTARLFQKVGVASAPCGLLLLPSLLAAIVSAWMNVFAYFERRSKKPFL